MLERRRRRIQPRVGEVFEKLADFGALIDLARRIRGGNDVGFTSRSCSGAASFVSLTMLSRRDFSPERVFSMFARVVRSLGLSAWRLRIPRSWIGLCSDSRREKNVPIARERN